MITVDEASRIVLDHYWPTPETEVSLAAALGLVLAEDLVADRDFPPYDRVTMDGIAIHQPSFAAGKRVFPIQEIAPAGAAQKTLLDNDHCIEVMTGAILPKNCDAVIRYEDLKISNGSAQILLDLVRPDQNVHQQGEDRAAGAVVVPAGTVLSAAEIGVAATVGKSRVRVRALPSVLIVSTGDELVEIEETPASHQIRKSNVHRIAATLKNLSMSCDLMHLSDDASEIQSKLTTAIDKYDVIVLSGGVSKGKFDFVPAVLDSLGVHKHFHKVRQRPGKPFWFGSLEAKIVVFALPGNPVSSFMCIQKYFIPWLNASLGLSAKPKKYALLAEVVEFEPDLTYFLQVKLEYDKAGRIVAWPVAGHGSGDLANLVDADAFLELPQGRNTFEKGEVYPFITYR